MKNWKIIFGVFMCISLTQSLKAADTIRIKSPDNHIILNIFKVGDAMQFYVSYKNQRISCNSKLEMSINGESITRDIQILKIAKTSFKEVYPVLGVHANAINNYQQVIIFLQHKDISYQLHCRVFDNGLAFQFEVSNQKGQKMIADEASSFKFPAASDIWSHDLKGHYEGLAVHQKLKDLPKGQWVAPPATLKLPSGTYISLTEADLKDYPGMAFQSDGNSGLVIQLAPNQPTSGPYKLRYSPEDTFRLRQPVPYYGKITTPWRVIMIGANLNSMVNNDIVKNLCPDPNKALFPKGIFTDWIRPGRAVWKYLDGGGPGTLEVMKHFTDAAAELGFENNVLEGFWSNWPERDLKNLIDYSKSKGVGIWLWKHSKSLRDPAIRDAFLKHCHELGVRGVKIDFFDSEAKEVIDLYTDILKEAAKYKILVDFHGADKPTGLARTYPNEMVREAVKGMESSKLEDRATHETTIPFTRLLAGPAEYTVVHFGNRRKNTSITHQIASAAILNGGPLLTYASNPDSLLHNPAVNIIKAIPAVWDETIVLPPSEIGELAVFARRKGNVWFLAIMNGVNRKDFTIDLKFLGKGSYHADIVKDADNTAMSESLTTRRYNMNDKIVFHLKEGGGYIAMFKK